MRLELTTLSLGKTCSIHLSYGRNPMMEHFWTRTQVFEQPSSTSKPAILVPNGFVKGIIPEMIDTTKGLGAAVKGLAWGICAGAFSAAGTALYNYRNYADPIDWQGLAHAGIVGAILGGSAWFQTHRALWQSPPGTVAVRFEQLKEIGRFAAREAVSQASKPPDPPK
jgi:hypothetical protein